MDKNVVKGMRRKGQEDEIRDMYSKFVIDSSCCFCFIYLVLIENSNTH